MWLLDVNLPNGLLGVLRAHGISCETAVSRGWRDLTNGALAQAAFDAGFRVLLTRDRLFAESARGGLRALPGLAVVIVTLAQLRETAYLSEFEAAWRRQPIEPLPGTVIRWP